MKDFMTQITDWLFKHPIVRHQYSVTDHGGHLTADDVVDSLVEHSRNELEKCVLVCALCCPLPRFPGTWQLHGLLALFGEVQVHHDPAPPFGVCNLPGGQ
jgi:hypothetical protein